MKTNSAVQYELYGRSRNTLLLLHSFVGANTSTPTAALDRGDGCVTTRTGTGAFTVALPKAYPQLVSVGRMVLTAAGLWKVDLASETVSTDGKIAILTLKQDAVSGIYAAANPQTTEEFFLQIWVRKSARR